MSSEMEERWNQVLVLVVFNKHELLFRFTSPTDHSYNFMIYKM